MGIEMNVLDEYRLRAFEVRLCKEDNCTREACVAGKDRAKLVDALQAVLESLEHRAEQYRATSDRLNQEVVDKHPDKDAKTAMRYSSYASNSEATLHAARGRIAQVLA